MIEKDGLITNKPLRLFNPGGDKGIVTAYWARPAPEQPERKFYISFSFNWPGAQGQLTLEQEERLREALHQNVQDYGFHGRPQTRTVIIDW